MPEGENGEFCFVVLDIIAPFPSFVKPFFTFFSYFFVFDPSVLHKMQKIGKIPE